MVARGAEPVAKKLNKTAKRFSDLEIKQLAAIETDKTRLFHDGDGLYFVCDRRGSRNWTFRYMVDGRARTLGLGRYPAVGLAEARRRVSKARDVRTNGYDPLERKDAERKAKLLARQTAMTFRQAADALLASKQDGWSERSAKEWRLSLEAYAYPLVGMLSVAEIDNAAILRVLQQPKETSDGKTERLWTAVPDRAKKLQNRLETVIGWAIAGGHRTADNPARWDILKHQLPAKSSLPRGRVKHHAAVAIGDMGEFMPRLRNAEGMGARALELAILTAARSGEVRGATWGEIDMENRVWTVPADRMKARREHRVPLSPAAVAILEAQPKGAAGDLVFPAAKGGQLSDMTLSAVMRRMKLAAVPHGFRSTFRDWGSERTNFPSEMLEMALAHTVSDKVEAAYRRGDMFDKRRALMDAWAAFLAAPAGGNVTDIAAARGAA
jgi:integrase